MTSSNILEYVSTSVSKTFCRCTNLPSRTSITDQILPGNCLIHNDTGLWVLFAVHVWKLIGYTLIKQLLLAQRKSWGGTHISKNASDHLTLHLWQSSPAKTIQRTSNLFKTTKQICFLQILPKESPSTCIWSCNTSLMAEEPHKDYSKNTKLVLRWPN